MRKLRFAIVLILILVIIEVFVKLPGEKEANINLEGKSALLVLAQRDFDYDEYTEIKGVLEKYGARVEVSSKSLGDATSQSGKATTISKPLRDVNPNNYDAVIFIGGKGAERYYTDPVALTLAKNMFKKGRVIAAIDVASGILANADVLSGKDATIWSGEERFIEMIKSAGGRYVDEDVVVDGNVATASSSSAARELAISVANLISGKK